MKFTRSDLMMTAHHNGPRSGKRLQSIELFFSQADSAFPFSHLTSPQASLILTPSGKPSIFVGNDEL